MPDNSVKIPKQISFSSLKRRLKKLDIYWHKRKGKGGHGSFVGLDKQGNNQSYPLPSDQHREVRKTYLRGLLRRFGLDPSDVFY